jgi:hypothetical protein
MGDERPSGAFRRRAVLGLAAFHLAALFFGLFFLACALFLSFEKSLASGHKRHLAKDCWNDCYLDVRSYLYDTRSTAVSGLKSTAFASGNTSFLWCFVHSAYFAVIP